MAAKPYEAPAVFNLIVFLAINYVVGFGLGYWLTGSTLGALAIAFLTPCLSLLGVALFGVLPAIDRSTPDEA